MDAVKPPCRLHGGGIASMVLPWCFRGASVAKYKYLATGDEARVCAHNSESGAAH